MRHRWAVAGVREVPWQSAPITVRVCRRCGCVRDRVPDIEYGRPDLSIYHYVMPDGFESYGKAPECPGEEPR